MEYTEDRLEKLLKRDLGESQNALELERLNTNISNKKKISILGKYKKWPELVDLVQSESLIGKIDDLILLSRQPSGSLIDRLSPDGVQAKKRRMMEEIMNQKPNNSFGEVGIYDEPWLLYENMEVYMRFSRKDKIEIAKVLEEKGFFKQAFLLQKKLSQDDAIKRLIPLVIDKQPSYVALELAIEHRGDKEISKILTDLIEHHYEYVCPISLYSVLSDGIKDKGRIDNIMKSTLSNLGKRSTCLFTDHLTYYFMKEWGNTEVMVDFYLKRYPPDDIKDGLELLQLKGISEDNLVKIRKKIISGCKLEDAALLEERWNINHEAMKKCSDYSPATKAIYHWILEGKLESIDKLMGELLNLKLDARKIKRNLNIYVSGITPTKREEPRYARKKNFETALAMANLFSGVKIGVNTLRAKLSNLAADVTYNVNRTRIIRHWEYEKDTKLEDFCGILDYLEGHYGLNTDERAYKKYATTLTIYRNLILGNIDEANKLILDENHYPLEESKLYGCAEECLKGDNNPFSGALYISELGNCKLDSNWLWEKVANLVCPLSFEDEELKISEGIYAYLDDPDSVSCMPTGTAKNLQLATEIMDHVFEQEPLSEPAQTVYNFVQKVCSRGDFLIGFDE